MGEHGWSGTSKISSSVEPTSAAPAAPTTGSPLSVLDPCVSPNNSAAFAIGSTVFSIGSGTTRRDGLGVGEGAEGHGEEGRLRIVPALLEDRETESTELLHPCCGGNGVGLNVSEDGGGRKYCELLIIANGEKKRQVSPSCLELYSNFNAWSVCPYGEATKPIILIEPIFIALVRMEDPKAPAFFKHGYTNIQVC